MLRQALRPDPCQAAMGRPLWLLLLAALLLPAAARAEREIAQQLEGNDEFATVVSALEQQYDQMAHLQSGAGGGLADLAPAGGVPTGDEIAAMVEEFLQGLAGEADEGKTEG